MCYLIRQAQSEAERGGTAPVPGIVPPRRRWVGAIAATLVGGLAVAALVAPPSTAPVSATAEPAAAVPLAARTATAPAGPVVEQTSGKLDDGVPADAGVVKAGSECSHSL
jgi:hypothetical protein